MRSSTVRPWPGNLFLVVLPLFLLAADPAAAGDQGWPDISFGVKGGPSLSQHQGTEPRDLEYTVDSTMRRGWRRACSSPCPSLDRFYLQQEVLYVQQGVAAGRRRDIFDIPTVLDVTYDMDYLEIPLLLRYHWLIDRRRRHLLPGWLRLRPQDQRPLPPRRRRQRRQRVHPPARRQRHVRGRPLRLPSHVRHGPGVPAAGGSGCSWSTASTSACSSCRCPPTRTCPSVTRPSASTTTPSRCATSATCCSWESGSRRPRHAARSC